MESVLFPVLCGSIAGVIAFWIGYRVGLWTASLERNEGPESVPEPPTADRSAYDAAYPPEQRERNRRQLELMDEFAGLQHERNALIRKAGEVGYEILDGPDMARLKLETLAVLEKLIAYEPVGFYRDVYDELLAELSGADGSVLQ